MFKPNISFYLGEEKKGGFSGVLAENNFFLCFEIYFGLKKSDGYRFIEKLKAKIKEKLLKKKYLVNSLSEFDDFISSFITENNFPTGFSLTAGYLKDDVFYLKTINEGKIYIRRKGKFGLLLEESNTASGKIEDKDFFLFATSNFIDLLGGRGKIEEEFEDKNPKEIIEKITPILKNKNDSGAVAVLVEFLKEEEIDEENIFEEDFSQKKEKPVFLNNLKNYFLLMKNSKKTLTIITAIFLFLLLIWTTTTGIKRKNNLLIDKKANQAEELIKHKLETAEEVAFLNIDRALILLKQSREELEKIKKEAEKLKAKSEKIKEIEELIKKTEDKIIKTEKASFKEFFDLSVDSQDASGDKIYLASDIGYILDKKRKTIYKLSLEKKSLEKVEFERIKSADLIAGDDKKLFFYIKNDGIYQSENLGKPKKIIENDKDWGEIVDIFVYNGNLYLLDREKDEIWKYLKTSDGFSQKTSYFDKGEAIDLSNISSFSIDGSIYLSSKKNIYRYISGKRESFSFNLPLSDFNFNKIFTNKDLEKIYLLDNSRGAVYILSKTGDYIEQISSEIFSKADDFFAYKEKIYVLIKNKIYKID